MASELSRLLNHIKVNNGPTPGLSWDTEEIKREVAAIIESEVEYIIEPYEWAILVSWLLGHFEG